MSIYLTLPVPKTPLPELMDMKKSAKTTEMIAISFITCHAPVHISIYTHTHTCMTYIHIHVYV